MHRPPASLVRRARAVLFMVLALPVAVIALPAAATAAPAPQGQDFALPASDDGLPGTGTLRRFGWFQKLWQQRRSKWAGDVEADQGAVVFLGDSITQGFDDLASVFPDLKVCNRGISGDTTRGMLLRLDGDVLAVNPRAVVMLMGTNDLEEGDTAEGIAGNVREIVRRIVAHDEDTAILWCRVFPSSAKMRRSSAAIRAINERCEAALVEFAQVTVVDTWSIFANAEGDATKADFPDLLHPNALGYRKWAAALRPAMTARGLAHPNMVVWQGVDGPGAGKHIVFVAGDHEYRGEETLPALARILAKRYGFRCTFVVTTDPATGEIEPGSNHITGLEVLASADLFVPFLRFQHFDDEQMQHIEDYLAAGKPVLGLRTSTHAFKGLKGRFAKYNEGYKGPEEEWRFGFGEAVLGEHWVGHFGRNHKQSSILVIEDGQQEHPILRGVERPHAQCGGYVGHPKDGVTLARGQVLDGMAKDSPPAQSERQQTRHAVAWVRTYRDGVATARVFATTHGASEDILDDDFRRMLINAHLWCVGLEDAIVPDGPIDFVGPYHPATFAFGGYRRGVRPADIAGWEAPIYDRAKPTRAPK